jgi:hypothetical protein
VKQKLFGRKPIANELRDAVYMPVFGWSIAWYISDELAYKMF